MKLKIDIPNFVILVDSNEQHPFEFPDGVPTRREKLYPGDYSVDGLRSQFAVERKSLDDLIGTLFGKSQNADGSFIRRIDKFSEELTVMGRMRSAFVAVEEPRSRLESHYYNSTVPPTNVMGILADIEINTGVEFKFFDNRAQAARWVALRAFQEWKTAHGLSSFKPHLRPERLTRKPVDMPKPPILI